MAWYPLCRTTCGEAAIRCNLPFQYHCCHIPSWRNWLILQSPIAAKPWVGVRDGGKYGSVCSMYVSFIGALRLFRGTEVRHPDSLTLDVQQLYTVPFKGLSVPQCSCSTSKTGWTEGWALACHGLDSRRRFRKRCVGWLRTWILYGWRCCAGHLELSTWDLWYDSDH